MADGRCRHAAPSPYLSISGLSARILATHPVLTQILPPKIAAMAVHELFKPCCSYLTPVLPLKCTEIARPPTAIFHQGIITHYSAKVSKGGRLVVKCSSQGEQKSGERRNFLSVEEAGLVEISGLSTHERFLCRLTISSLNLLRVISEQEGVPIEELNAGRLCDWFMKDKLKREQDLGSAVLQWDDSEFQF